MWVVAGGLAAVSGIDVSYAAVGAEACQPPEHCWAPRLGGGQQLRPSSRELVYYRRTLLGNLQAESRRSAADQNPFLMQDVVKRPP